MMEQTQKKETMIEQIPQMQPSASKNKKAEQAAELLELSQRLFEYAMEDQWEKVVEAYNEKPMSHEAKITEAEDTALHLAVSGGKLEFVYKLVEILRVKKASNGLKAKNIRGNTPLHAAAALGNARMCHCMASKDPNLIAEKNINNETPFHLAAYFGHKDAFRCLLDFCSQEKRSDICSRNTEGNTILHAAIDGEHFDLAFQIICKYPELMNAVNVNGFSPLHLLAKKPNAFKSGSRLGLFDQILYSCIIVDEIKDKEDNKKDYLKKFEENGSRGGISLPKNYETCGHFFQMFLGVVCFSMPRSGVLSYFNHKTKTCNSTTDEENPQAQGTSKATQGESSSSVSPIKSESNNSNAAAKGSPDSDTGSGNSPKAEEDRKDESSPAEHREDYFPANYATFIQFFKLGLKFMMVFLRLVFPRIRKIRRKKQRHTWAPQVMNKLIENNPSMYKYSGVQTASGIGERTVDLPPYPSLISSSDQDTKTGGEKSSDERGERQNETDYSKEDGNDAMMVKLLEKYHIRGIVDSKTPKYAVQMKFEEKVIIESTKPESPILIAASNGITEMVEKILEKFPVAIQDVDSDMKNVVLLAVENRHTHTFQLLIERKFLHESVFRQSENRGNNALHLAATHGHDRPWLIPGSALQMHWELKWYKFVKKSLAKYLLVHYNNNGQTPKQIFTETHKDLVKDGSQWLTKTSESCSLVAALIATVAFASSATIPGGVKQESGKPVLGNEPAFLVFAISSLLALCFSVAAIVFFLAIHTSTFEEKDFAYSLPYKLLLGLTGLFTSIVATVVSFLAGHFFELNGKLKVVALPIYIVTCLPILFALAQLPLYFNLIRAIVKRVPQRR